MADRRDPGVDISVLLRELAAGDNEPEAARERVFEAAYVELRRVAGQLMRGERGDHTLDPTALVNEAYVRLAGEGADSFESRAHFFGIAVRAMRQVLIHHARRRDADKRGGDHERVTLRSNALVSSPNVDLLDLDAALTRLAALDERMSNVVELRFFGGLTAEEAAVVLGVTRKTVQADWKVAKMWLRRELA